MTAILSKSDDSQDGLERADQYFRNGDTAPGSISIVDLAIDIAVQKMVSAFSGRRFKVGDLRDIVRAVDEKGGGDKWNVLKMASGTKVRMMSDETLQELALTTVQYFRLDVEIWMNMPPSRLRWALAHQRREGAWTEGIKTHVLSAAAFLFEEVPFVKRTEPVEVATLAQDLSQGTSIAVPDDKRDAFSEEFVLSENAGQPAAID